MTRRSMFTLLGVAQIQGRDASERIRCADLPQGFPGKETCKDPEPSPTMHAPFYCGGESDDLGLVSVIDDGVARGPRPAQPDMHLMRCRFCGGLWAREVKETTPPR